MNGSTHSIRADAVAAQPWRNGGGGTRELLRCPDDEHWVLRISLADIERDGPFSSFPATQRWFAVVEGEGVVLRFGDQLQRMSVESAPLCFDGAAPPDCHLVRGATRDLNLMLRDATGEMRAIEPGHRWNAAYDQCGLFTLCAGVLQGGAGAPIALTGFTLVWPIPGGKCSFTPDAPGRCGWWLGASATSLAAPR